VPDAAAAVDLRLTVAWALGRLPERQRAVLVLRYLFDLPDAEVGEILGVATATVRSQAARAIARLRELSGAACSATYHQAERAFSGGTPSSAHGS
jgi:DNA-directed RNA polymerase specialized sigma24 family protein